MNCAYIQNLNSEVMRRTIICYFVIEVLCFDRQYKSRVLHFYGTTQDLGYSRQQTF